MIMPELNLTRGSDHVAAAWLSGVRCALPGSEARSRGGGQEEEQRRHHLRDKTTQHKRCVVFFLLFTIKKSANTSSLSPNSHPI